MNTNAVQGVADDQAITGSSVIERLYSEMIAGAKQTSLLLIPNGESEVSDQAPDAIGAPGVIGMKNQFDIGGVFKLAATSGFETAYEIVSSVNPRIGDDPNLIIQTERLPLAERLIRRA